MQENEGTLGTPDRDLRPDPYQIGFDVINTPEYVNNMQALWAVRRRLNDELQQRPRTQRLQAIEMQNGTVIEPYSVTETGRVRGLQYAPQRVDFDYTQLENRLMDAELQRRARVLGEINLLFPARHPHDVKHGGMPLELEDTKEELLL